MSRLFGLTCVVLASLLWAHATCSAAERLALLIGNEAYNEKVGPLTNPHNDIDLVGKALEELGFKITKVKDADFTRLHTAVRGHIARVREAGPETISFIYYSGHGAADKSTRRNYLIPVNVPDAETSSLWENSVELKADVTDKLVTQAPDAAHLLVFDACRNELQLRVKGVKALEADGKALVPESPQGPILISYATAPGRTASYVLTRPISWVPNTGQAPERVNVPPGFVTDFASIPRAFWSFLPPDGEYVYAAILHDYLYWVQDRSREESDEIFKFAMEDLKIGGVTIGTIHTTVRLAGGSAWDSNKQAKQQGEKRIAKTDKLPNDPTTRWEDFKKRPDVFAD